MWILKYYSVLQSIKQERAPFLRKISHHICEYISHRILAIKPRIATKSFIFLQNSLRLASVVDTTLIVAEPGSMNMDSHRIIDKIEE